MFLIQCAVDRSLCIVKECDVICDENVVKKGDSVKFHWKKKSYEGLVVSRSEDEDLLMKELQEMKSSKKTMPSKANDVPALGKRQSRRPRSFSPSEETEVVESKKAKVNTRAKNAKSTGISIKGKKEPPIQKHVIKSSVILKKKVMLSESSDTSTTTEEDREPVSTEHQPSNGSSSNQKVAPTKNRDVQSKSPSKAQLKAMLKKYQASAETIEKDSAYQNVKSLPPGPTETEGKKSLGKISTNGSPNIFEVGQSQTSRLDDTGNKQVSDNGNISNFSNESQDSHVTSDGDLSNGSCISCDNDNDDHDPRKGTFNHKENAASTSTQVNDPMDSDSNCILENVGDDDQLFGKNYALDEMVHLQDGIYCKKKVWRLAIGSSHLATHVARKLLEGVFKHESLMTSTLTGQAARAQGKDRQIEVSSLHAEARDAIIGFAKSIANRQKWMEQDDKTIKKAMAQKLVELKQQAKKNADRNRVE